MTKDDIKKKELSISQQQAIHLIGWELVDLKLRIG